MPGRSGLSFDFLDVRTADRIRRIGVGLPSSIEVNEGCSNVDAGDGDRPSEGAGEKSNRSTRSRSLSVALATWLRSADYQHV